MDYSKMNMSQLRALAGEYGIMPAEGSGKNGAVTKQDIIDALEANMSVANQAAVVTAEADPSSKRYLFDHFYTVVESFNGHKVGASVINLGRNEGNIALEQGYIRLDTTKVPRTNPRASARRLTS